ncbi:histone acetyltransferase HPA2 [Pseudomonas sp. GOM7]|uniref:DUF7931 domain-containing protein n=1 Tax=unclassified Pseudomonas TaxID=196821 RepID=UPI00227A0920|nr:MULTISPECIES: histone acetyltransferase HPA2 [unclassified Pseudomonas]WAJ39886.1 histone acetyltransferase HPA2 [Pseudomonas sp. GOM7]
MNDKHVPADTIDTPESMEMAAIEFQSPGRFAVHNPEPVTPEARQWDAAPFILGQHERLERFSQPPEACAHVLALMQQAQRSLCLYSDDLEPWLYNHGSVQQACSRFLLASPRARLRILLRDTSRAVKEGHRLLALSRRLSSNLHIRKLNPDYPSLEQSYLIADDSGLLLRPELDQHAGYAVYADPARVRQHRTQFDQAWDTSITDPDLRSFLL